MSELRAQALHKTYKRRHVVQGVSVAIGSGEVVGLLGPNGAGKTTCFYMIVGLVPMQKGRIFLDQQDISRAAMHQRARLGVGYLPQEPSVFRRLTVAENIAAIPLKPRTTPRETGIADARPAYQRAPRHPGCQPLWW